MCGMKGLNCSHKQATRSLLGFFERALSLAADERKWGAAAIASQQPAIQAIFHPIGPPFVMSLLHGVAGGLPYDLCREAGDVIFLLRKSFGQAAINPAAAAAASEADAWIYQAISTLPAPKYTDEMKQEYMARLQAATDGKQAKNTLQMISHP